MKSIIIIIMFIVSLGCLGYPTDWNIDLWEQKIANSSFSIYKFDAWGGRDSHVSGLKIIESSKGFTQNDVLTKDEFTFLKTIPSKNQLYTIKTIRQNGENSNKPINNETYQIEGLTINQETYKYSGSVTGICTLKSYKFKSFEETKDSLIFHQNESQFKNGKNYKRISIPKGNVYLMTTQNNQNLTRVVYSDLVIFKDVKISNGIELCQMTKYFDPIDKIQISEFSDYGIYKPVK